jgi:hypothetical protein
MIITQHRNNNFATHMPSTAVLIIEGHPPISLTGCLFDDRALKTKHEDFLEEYEWERTCTSQDECPRQAEAFVLGDWKYEATKMSTRCI